MWGIFFFPLERHIWILNMCLDCHLHWGERRKDLSWAKQTHFTFSWGSVCIPLAGTWEAKSSAIILLTLNQMRGCSEFQPRKGASFRAGPSLCRHLIADTTSLDEGGLVSIPFIKYCCWAELQSTVECFPYWFWAKPPSSPIFWSSEFSSPQNLLILAFSLLCSSLGRQEVLFPLQSWEMNTWTGEITLCVLTP